MNYPDAPAPLRPSRRRFVQGLALGGVAAGLGFARLPAFAIESARGDAKRHVVVHAIQRSRDRLTAIASLDAAGDVDFAGRSGCRDLDRRVVE